MKNGFKAVRRKFIYWCLLITPFVLCQFSFIAKATDIINEFNASTRFDYISGIDLDLRSTDNFTLDLKKTNSTNVVANIKPLIVSDNKTLKIFAYELNGSEEKFISSMELTFQKKHKFKPIKFKISLGRFESNSKDIILKISDNDLNIVSEMKATFTAENIDAQPEVASNGNQCDPLDVNCFVRNTLSELNPKIGKYSAVQENTSGGFDIVFAIPKSKRTRRSVRALDFSAVNDPQDDASTSVGQTGTSSQNLVRPDSILASDAEGKPFWKSINSFNVTSTSSISLDKSIYSKVKDQDLQLQDLLTTISSLNAQLASLQAQVSSHIGDSTIHEDTILPTSP
jgi:hypothetical protein